MKNNKSNIKKLSLSTTGTNRPPTWTFTGAWNKSLNRVERYSPYKRDYLWASQLGNSQVDIWMALNGQEPSNPFTNRAKRKFDAGVFWEWVVELVAKRAGIFLNKQEYVKYKLDNCLSVTGKYDLKIGGKRNIEQIRKMEDALEIISLPKRFIEAMETVEEEMNFKNELPVRILEVKSTSAYMYDAQYKNGIPAENHALQVLHYLLGTNEDEGAIVYISKDDSRMMEIPIWKDDLLLNEKYKEIVALATYYIRKKEKPPLEPEIIFDFNQSKFTDNWNIKYSAYLTALYGFEKESDYQDAFKGRIASWNRVFGRIKRGKKMTKSNLKYLEEIKKQFPDFDELVEHFREDDLENHEDGYFVT